MSLLTNPNNIVIRNLSSFATARNSDHRFLLLWIQHGNGTYRIDRKEFPITSSTVYCLYPGQFGIFIETSILRGYALSFPADFFSPLNGDWRLIHSGLFDPCEPLAIIPGAGVWKELDQHLQVMIQEQQENSSFSNEIQAALLKILIVRLWRESGKDMKEKVLSTNSNLLVNEFHKLVQTNFTTMKKVSDYARVLGIAPNYLNAKVRKISGQTASYYIQQRIILEAKRRARWEGMTLKEIAYSLGYDDLAHFSKFFKNAAGVNFSDFKRFDLLA